MNQSVDGNGYFKEKIFCFILRFASFVRNGGIFKEEEIEEYENFEVAEDEDSWLSSDQEQLPESTKDDILEESF